MAIIGYGWNDHDHNYFNIHKAQVFFYSFNAYNCFSTIMALIAVMAVMTKKIIITVMVMANLPTEGNWVYGQYFLLLNIKNHIIPNGDRVKPYGKFLFTFWSPKNYAS